MGLKHVSHASEDEPTPFDRPQIYSMPGEGQKASGKSETPEAEDCKRTSSIGAENGNRASNHGGCEEVLSN